MERRGQRWGGEIGIESGRETGAEY